MKAKIILVFSFLIFFTSVEVMMQTNRKITELRKERQDFDEQVKIMNETKDELDDWDLLRLAIIKTECDFNSNAVGKSQDVGIFQITPIYVKDVNRILKDDVYTHNDAFDIAKSIEMFNVIQKHYNPNLDRDKAVKIQNPRGDAIGYAKRVKANMQFINSYEQVRTAIIESRTANL